MSAAKRKKQEEAEVEAEKSVSQLTQLTYKM